MDTTTTGAAETANAQSVQPSTAQAEKPAEKPAEKLYSKDELTKIVQREVGKITAEVAPLREKLTVLEQEKQAAEEAKLSAAQRAELERKREKDAYEAKIADLDARAKKERETRQQLMRSHAASSVVSRFAARLFNPEIAQDVERLVAERVVVEVGSDGAERVALVMGAPGDTEPLSDAAVQKFADAHLTRFFKAQGGSGGQHGGSTNGRTVARQIVNPTDRMAEALAQRGRH
jgi:hypothetical protein